MNSEKFSLKWNDFQQTMSNSFGILKKEQDFFDVTLVSDDEVHVSSHKLVLSACSEFFKSILKKGVRVRDGDKGHDSLLVRQVRNM